MKLFLAIAITIGGVVLLISAIADMTQYGSDVWGGRAFFGVVFLAAGITWLWQIRWQFLMARLTAEGAAQAVLQEMAHNRKPETTKPSAVEAVQSNGKTTA